MVHVFAKLFNEKGNTGIEFKFNTISLSLVFLLQQDLGSNIRSIYLTCINITQL